MYEGVNVVSSEIDSSGSEGNFSESTRASNTALDEVGVLSLPVFAWFKANYTAQNNRGRHIYNIVGNRQMITIEDSNIDDQNIGTESKNSFILSFDVFDLAELTGSSGYDAHAAPYEISQVVKDWYNTG